MPKLSVIMPVYNTEAYLSRSIESVLAQTFTDFEFILVDDGSKDHSLEICKKYAESDERIRVFHQENAGALKARLRGVKEAHAERMIFIDSDDYIDSDMYERMYAEMETGVDLCFCDISFERMDGKKVKSDSYDGSVKRYTREEMLTAFFDNFRFYLGYTWNVMIRRELFDQVDFSAFHYSNGEDMYENFCMLMMCSQVNYIYRDMYHYIYDRMGSICNQKQSNQIINMVELSRFFYSRIVNELSELEPVAFKYEYWCNRSMLIDIARRGDIKNPWEKVAKEYCKRHYKRYIALGNNLLSLKIKVQWLLNFPKLYALVSRVKVKKSYQYDEQQKQNALPGAENA